MTNKWLRPSWISIFRTNFSSVFGNLNKLQFGIQQFEPTAVLFFAIRTNFSSVFGNSKKLQFCIWEFGQTSILFFLQFEQTSVGFFLFWNYFQLWKEKFELFSFKDKNMSFELSSFEGTAAYLWNNCIGISMWIDGFTTCHRSQTDKHQRMITY